MFIHYIKNIFTEIGLLVVSFLEKQFLVTWWHDTVRAAWKCAVIVFTVCTIEWNKQFMDIDCIGLKIKSHVQCFRIYCINDIYLLWSQSGPWYPWIHLRQWPMLRSHCPSWQFFAQRCLEISPLYKDTLHP